MGEPSQPHEDPSQKLSIPPKDPSPMPSPPADPALISSQDVSSMPSSSTYPSPKASAVTEDQQSNESLPSAPPGSQPKLSFGRSSKTEETSNTDKMKKNSLKASLKFGEPKMSKGKKKYAKPIDVPVKPSVEFNPDNYPRMTAFFFHKDNDLSLSKGLGYKPEQARPRHGPGVTAEIEQMYGPCTLLSEFKYTTWADTVVPLRNHNVVQGFNELTLFLIKLAANGGENISHEEAFLAMSFLSNIRNDLGEYPPNVLALMERIDFLTRGDGKAETWTKHVGLCDIHDM